MDIKPGRKRWAGRRIEGDNVCWVEIVGAKDLTAKVVSVNSVKKFTFGDGGCPGSHLELENGLTVIIGLKMISTRLSTLGLIHRLSVLKILNLRMRKEKRKIRD